MRQQTQNRELKLVLYDYMQVAGGAERVTLALASAFPEYQTVVNRKYRDAEPLLVQSDVTVSELGIPTTRWMTRIPEAAFNFRFRARCVEQAHTVLYSGFYAPLAVHLQKTGLRVYYCHTIPRFAYDLYAVTRAGFPWVLRGLYGCFSALVRWQYKRAVSKMDRVLVNSENVRRRLKQFVGIDAHVVYPPVATDRFKWTGDGGYYLSIARLTSNKRVDVIVQAFLRMPDRKLVVASGGPELARLKAIAGGAPNIAFVGWLSEDGLRQHVGNAHAAIYLPVDEDFGMSPVECMAAGKAVIGVAEGGLLETVVHGQTGILIQGPPTPEKIQAAVLELEKMCPDSMRQACEARASLFSEARFIDAVKAQLGSDDETD
jgi:glycosyltransferase involved in cell wall biosynthesis